MLEGCTVTDIACATTTGANECLLSGPGTGTSVQLTSETIKLLSLSGNRYRYFLTGSFTVGRVDVGFQANSFGSSSTGNPVYTNLAETESFTVLGPTTALESPDQGDVIGVGTLNDRGFLDIPITAPAGRALDLDTITDIDPEFTILLDGAPDAGDRRLDRTQAPLLLVRFAVPLTPSATRRAAPTPRVS